MGLEAGEGLTGTLEDIPIRGSEALHPAEDQSPEREIEVSLASRPGCAGRLLPWVNSAHDAHRVSA